MNLVLSLKAGDSEEGGADGLANRDREEPDHESCRRPIRQGVGSPDQINPCQHYVCRSENGTSDECGDRAEAKADRQDTGCHQAKEGPVNAIETEPADERTGPGSGEPSGADTGPEKAGTGWPPAQLARDELTAERPECGARCSHQKRCRNQPQDRSCDRRHTTRTAAARGGRKRDRGRDGQHQCHGRERAEGQPPLRIRNRL